MRDPNPGQRRSQRSDVRIPISESDLRVRRSDLRSPNQISEFRGPTSVSVSASVFVSVAFLLLLQQVPAQTRTDATPAEVLFATKVRPLLVEKCFPCHGGDPKKIRGELELNARAAMLRGGETSQKVLVPGKASESLLYLAVTWTDPDYEMPPKANDRLSEAQTWWIRDWIDGDAPWPEEERIEAILKAQSEGIIVATSGGLSEDWDRRRYKPENLWAYRPIVRPPVPQEFLPSGGGSSGEIDAFIHRRLDASKLEPAPRANRWALIRRVTFDLIGLPPSPEEVDAFVGDPQPDAGALARVVERLLASPHYGEQWGRHWLDVVRYADSSGFANDYERPNAWRYRDYVVRSFNQDKPFDQFVREQIAGDEIDPDDPEMLIATGFLRMGPWEHTGMSVAKITRQQFLDDITDSVGQVFLSHPLQCSRCHDHKFDPIPTRDYYSIQAVFATTQFTDRDAGWLESENQRDFESEESFLKRRIERYETTLKGIREKGERAERAWYAERGLEYAPRSALLKKGVPAERIAPRHLGLSTEDFGVERIARKNLIRHRWELDRFKPIAFSVYSGKTPSRRNVQQRLQMPKDPAQRGTLEKTAILSRGDPFSPAQRVVPGILSCVPGPDKLEGLDEADAGISGRRRAFARWVASAENPLTARSIVNRVWQYHFGQGIAGNPNNFGSMGQKPSHPELLDWLAATFVEGGWSIKDLHRRILSSEVYARSSEHPDTSDVLARDPRGVSYAFFRPRRLSAEELRDSMLSVSAELNPQLGGIPVRPEMHLEAALQPRQIMGTYAPAYQPSRLPRQRNRRTIYALKLRGQRDPFLEVFNRPGSERSCERRDTSTVTPQVFSLLNGEQSYARALAMAERVKGETDSRESTVRRAFRLAYARQPQPDELDASLAHWKEMTARHRDLTFEPRTFPREVVRHAVEEMNGEPFEFTERLEVYEDYVPDRGPSDVGPEVRGLAELCLVLLNSNEFIYVP